MPLLRAGSQIMTHGGLSTPTPTLTELLTNASFETGTPPTGWTSSGATFERSNTQAYSGTYSAHFISNNVNQGVYQSPVLALNDWVVASCWFYVVTSLQQRIRGSTLNNLTRLANGTAGAWVQIYATDRCTTAGATAITFGPQVSAAENYMDDASVKRITLASMFSTKDIGNANMDVSAAVTVYATGLRAGVVARLNSATTPTAFLIASHDGTNVRLTQLIGGVYTELINTAVTYVAGAVIRILVTGTTAKLYYGGTQRGTDQTVDAGLTGTLGGKMSMHPSNTIGAFVGVAV